METCGNNSTASADLTEKRVGGCLRARVCKGRLFAQHDFRREHFLCGSGVRDFYRVRRRDGLGGGMAPNFGSVDGPSAAAL